MAERVGGGGLPVMAIRCPFVSLHLPGFQVQKETVVRLPFVTATWWPSAVESSIAVGEAVDHRGHYRILYFVLVFKWLQTR